MTVDHANLRRLAEAATKRPWEVSVVGIGDVCDADADAAYIVAACNAVPEDRVRALEAEKNSAYRERDQLVAVLSQLWPSHLAWHEGEWEDGWRNIVCIHGPTGQLTWHVHDSELPLFAHLGDDPYCDWDGHTTEDKYGRLAKFRGDTEPRVGALEALLREAADLLNRSGLTWWSVAALVAKIEEALK